MTKKYTIPFLISICVVFIFSTKKIQTNKVAGNKLMLSVNAADSGLQLINGIYYYHQKLFSGITTDSYNNGTLHHKISYYNGKEEGWTMIYYPDGNLSERRYYHLGEKDSVHTGWWQNGKPRFEYHFAMGLYNGDYLEWYNGGNLYKHIYYANGADDWGKGWRENGKLFMNYVMQNGRRYGIVNSNLCYTLKNEKGEFINSSVINDRINGVNNDSKLH